MTPTLAKYRNRQVFSYQRRPSGVPSRRIAGISGIILLGLTLLPSSAIDMYLIQGTILQTINLNQHLIWQYPLLDELELVRLSANGRTIAVTTGIEPSTLTVLDGLTGQTLWGFTPTGLSQENRTITSLGISANGEYLAIGTSGGSILMFHRSSSAIVQTWQAYAPITAISLSEIGTFITITFSRHIYFLRRLDGGVIWSLTPALTPNVITNVTSDQNGNHLAVSTSLPVLTFIFSSNQIYWNLNLTEPTSVLQLNADGTQLFMMGETSSRLMDQNGETSQIYPIVSQLFAFSASGARIAMAPNETLYLYSDQSPTPLRNHTFTGETPTSLELTYQADVLLLGTQAGTLYTINPQDFEPLWTLLLGEPITHLLTPNTGDSFLVTTPNTLLTLRISSISGFYSNLLPLLVIIGVSIVAGIITLILLRPKHRKYRLVNDYPAVPEDQES